jgi:hypothetical protein
MTDGSAAPNRPVFKVREGWAISPDYKITGIF